MGAVGAMLGGFLFKAVGLQAVGLLGSLIMATAGAVVLLALVSALRKR